METILAAALPLLVSVGAVYLLSGDRDLRRATVLFAFLTAVWLAPSWATLRTPVSLDFLLDAPPLASRKPPSYLQKNFLLNDVPLQMLPWREAAVRSWREGSLPVLDRHAASGTPLWENLQAAVLYPPNLLSIPFSTFSWPLFLAASKLMIALLGTYLLVRELRAGPAAAIFAAVAYAFCVFSVAFLMFPHTGVTTLLPLLLFFLERRANGHRRAAVWAALTIFVMFTGGHPESMFHCAFVALPWSGRLLLRHPGHRLPLLRDFILAGLVAVLLAAPLLLPFAAYLPHTQRLHDIGTTGGFLSTPPPDLTAAVPFLVPNYFGNPRVHNYRHPFNFNELVSQFAGLTTLVFALGALVTEWRRLRWGALLFAILLALSTQPVGLQRVAEDIPIYGVTAHGRLRFALALLMAIAGGIGIDRFMRGQDRARFAAVAASMGLVVAAICLVSYPVFAQFGIRRLIFFTEIAALSGCAVIALSRWLPALARTPLLIALLFLDLFSVTGLYNPANGRELFYPPTPAIAALSADQDQYRMAGLGRTFQPNRGVFHSLEDIRPHDPMAFRPYVRFLDSGGLNRSTYFEEFSTLPSREVLDRLGVRYVMAPPGSSLGLPATYRGADADVYVNRTARSRYSLSSAGTLRVMAYGPSSAFIETTVPSPAKVISSEVALPGWSLLREGEEWPLSRGEDPFLSWDVPSGRSTFELRYRPRFLVAGSLLGAIGSLAVAVWVLLLRRR